MASVIFKHTHILLLLHKHHNSAQLTRVNCSFSFDFVNNYQDSISDVIYKV